MFYWPPYCTPSCLALVFMADEPSSSSPLPTLIPPPRSSLHYVLFDAPSPCFAVSLSLILLPPLITLLFHPLSGAIKGIRWILTLFFLSLFLVLAAILAGVIFMFLYRHSLSHQLEFVMKSSMRNNYMYKPQVRVFENLALMFLCISTTFN